MQSPVVPLVVLSHAQIVAQYNLNADVFMALLEALRGREKRLMRGGTGYFRSDIEQALQALRAPPSPQD